MLPEILQELIGEAVKEVKVHPHHNLSPVTRLNIYHSLDPIKLTPSLYPKRGWLGVLTVRRILPIWQRAMPLWESENDKSNLISSNLLPEHILKLTENLLLGLIDVQFTWKEANNYWDEVGNLIQEILEDFEKKVFNTAHVCNASLHALHETLGVEFLGKLKNWAKYNDEQLSNHFFACDTAASAVIAYAGGGNVSPFDPEKRLDFWEWWLTEAIPQAWELANSTYQPKEEGQ